MKCTLLWFRQDLRLEDNAALAAAIQRGAPIVPVFIWAPQEECEWAPGGAAKWWLHHALTDLDAQLAEHGMRLVIRDARDASSLEVLLGLAKQTKAEAVFWNRRYEPSIVDRDEKTQRALRAEGIAAEEKESSVLFAPEAIANKSGKPFQVFTPMWKHYQTLEIPKPARVNLGATKAPSRWPKSARLNTLDLPPTSPGTPGFYDFWETPSRKSALNACGNSSVPVPTTTPNGGTFRPKTEHPAVSLPPFRTGRRARNLVEVCQCKQSPPAFDTGIMRQLVLA